MGYRTREERCSLRYPKKLFRQARGRRRQQRLEQEQADLNDWQEKYQSALQEVGHEEERQLVKQSEYKEV